MHPSDRISCRFLTAIGMLGFACAAANAGQVLTAPEMETFLSDSVILEDFEGINLHAGSSFPAANPLNVNTVSGFFTIEAGVTYTSATSLSFVGAFANGNDSVILRSEDDLTVTFDEVQAGIGILVYGSFGSEIVTFYNGPDVLGVLVYDLSITPFPFAGWADTVVGITSVTITPTTPGASSYAIIDDMLFGAVFNPACLSDLNFDDSIDTADLGLLLSSFGTGNPTADINNDGLVDTADLGILLAAFDSSCP